MSLSRAQCGKIAIQRRDIFQYKIADIWTLTSSLTSHNNNPYARTVEVHLRAKFTAFFYALLRWHASIHKILTFHCCGGKSHKLFMFLLSKKIYYFFPLAHIQPWKREWTWKMTFVSHYVLVLRSTIYTFIIVITCIDGKGATSTLLYYCVFHSIAITRCTHTQR